jgi:hypothetical protein
MTSAHDSILATVVCLSYGERGESARAWCEGKDLQERSSRPWC